MSMIDSRVRVLGRDGQTILCIIENASTCRSCGVPIYWARTPSGRAMPVNFPNAVGDMVSHFVTCPHADQWRNKKPGTGRLTVKAVR
jgi:hypothetical protein